MSICEITEHDEEVGKGRRGQLCGLALSRDPAH